MRFPTRYHLVRWPLPFYIYGIISISRMTLQNNLPSDLCQKKSSILRNAYNISIDFLNDKKREISRCHRGSDTNKNINLIDACVVSRNAPAGGATGDFNSYVVGWREAVERRPYFNCYYSTTMKLYADDRYQNI